MPAGLLFRLLFRAGRLFDLAGRTFFYLAAGTLTRGDLARMSARAWQAFNASDVSASSGLYAWEQALYDHFLRPHDRVLIVGCGSGRDLLVLLSAGHEVVGVEASPLPADRARRLATARGHSPQILTARFEDAAIPGTFDLVVFATYSYGCVAGAARRVDLLRKAAGCLNPGGRVVVPYVAADRPGEAMPTRLARIASRLTRSDWRAEPHDRLFVVGVGSDPLFAYEHAFAPGQIDREIEDAGLAVIYEQRYLDVPVVVATLRHNE